MLHLLYNCDIVGYSNNKADIKEKCPDLDLAPRLVLLLEVEKGYLKTGLMYNSTFHSCPCLMDITLLFADLL